MTRYKLVVAYDGTDFRGWAAQTGLRTVQGTLKEAVRRVSGEETEIVGASRTDSGAHARGQVCHFDSDSGIPPERFRQALNRVLPTEVGITQASNVGPEFNSRFCAIDRSYRYRMVLGTTDPFRARFSHTYWDLLDIEKMRQAAQSLIGLHDFRGYTEELDKSVENTVRRVFAVEVKHHRDEIWIDVTATAFLRGMMRRIAGALFEVGKGAREVKDTQGILERWESYHLPIVLPAKGLTLMKVKYGRWPRDNRAKSG